MSDFMERKLTLIANKGGQANRQRFKTMEQQVLSGAGQMIDTGNENDMAAMRTTLESKSRLASLEQRLVNANANRNSGKSLVQAQGQQDSIGNQNSLQNHQLDAQDALKNNTVNDIGTALAGLQGFHGLFQNMANKWSQKDENGNVTIGEDGKRVMQRGAGWINSTLGVMNKLPGLGSADEKMVSNFKQQARVTKLFKTEEELNAHVQEMQDIYTSIGNIYKTTAEVISNGDTDPVLAGTIAGGLDFFTQEFNALMQYAYGGVTK